MKKKVNWAQNVKDPPVKRQCECQGCGKCIDPIKHYCGVWGVFKCEECKEWRCKSCITVWVCRYCKRM